MSDASPIPLNVAVLTVSDTRTPKTDTSGAAAVQALEAGGHKVVARVILPDDTERLRQQFQSWIADDGVAVVISTGGTGITRRDVTPEALAPLVSKEISGFGELFRMLSYEDIGASTIQSRAVGAICEKTLVFLLPGSTGAVRLAMDKILSPQLNSNTKPCNFVSLVPRL